MKKIILIGITIFLFIMAGTGCSSQSDKDRKGVEGIWQGTLKVSNTELRVVFNISRQKNNALSATLDSPDQGAKGIPVDKITIEKKQVRFEVQSVGGIFEGKIIERGKCIEGEWRQSGMTLPLTLERIDKAPEVARPQEPEKPYPYCEEELVYENRDAGVKLAGTLTIPNKDSQFPAVLLISGSGPQDRNETVFGHKPFLILADYLTLRGIAVLRMDDRGVGGSTGIHSTATSEDFADDVLAGVQYLKSRKEIDTQKIGLIGHSEGGMIAALVAAESPDVSFIVMMAGTGITGEKILYMQNSLIGKANGVSEEHIAFNRKLQECIFTILKEEKDDAIAKIEIRKVITDALSELSDGEKQALGYIETTLDAQVESTVSPWFRFFLTYNPRPTLMNVKCPVLAINGEKDLQVPPGENLSAIEEALKAGGNRDYTIKEFLNLNHLFQNAETGSPTEYAKIEETISPIVLQMIGDWILKQ